MTTVSSMRAVTGRSCTHTCLPGLGQRDARSLAISKLSSRAQHSSLETEQRGSRIAVLAHPRQLADADQAAPVFVRQFCPQQARHGVCIVCRACPCKVRDLPDRSRCSSVLPWTHFLGPAGRHTKLAPGLRFLAQGSGSAQRAAAVLAPAADQDRAVGFVHLDFASGQ